MALTRVETQVTWSAANSVSVAANSSQTSDTITLDDTCIAARILMKADNSGTPNAADTIYFWALETMGDPDGAGADEYVTPEHAHFLGNCRTADEDPALNAGQIPIPQKSFQLYAEGITATTVTAITVSATIIEMRSS